jgi:hypothetical protein
LLESLATADSPIAELCVRLAKTETTILKYDMRHRLLFASTYLRVACLCLDTTDTWNFTTSMILRDATKELHEIVAEYHFIVEAWMDVLEIDEGQFMDDIMNEIRRGLEGL